MGLMDFFKKGKEKPVEQKPVTPSTQVTPPKTSREYTIKSGDTLSKIAKQYYGDSNAWNKIYEANKGTIKDPDKIYPGQKIIIP